jgi:hypothetical protein
MKRASKKRASKRPAQQRKSSRESVQSSVELRKYRIALGEHTIALQLHQSAMREQIAILQRIAIAAPFSTDPIVQSCIAKAAQPGAPFTDDSKLNGIPVEPDDLIKCLNKGLTLTDPYRYTSGQIDGAWTVRKLKSEGHNRYLACH